MIRFLPEETRDHPVEGQKLRYYRAGAGDTILLVHGITTYSFIWHEVFQRLKKHYDVIAVDLMGCGDSGKSVSVDFSLKNHAGILLRFLRDLDIRHLHIAGHDVGGGIVQIMMVRAAAMFHSVSLINTVAYDFWPVQPIINMRTPIIRQLSMAALDIGMLRMLVSKGVYHKDRVDQDLMERYHYPLRTREGRKAFLHFARCLDNQNLLEIEGELRQYHCPVLIIRGDHDVYLSSSIAERLHREIPRSKLVRISSGGHFIMPEEPDLVTKAIMDHTKS